MYGQDEFGGGADGFGVILEAAEAHDAPAPAVPAVEHADEVAQPAQEGGADEEGAAEEDGTQQTQAEPQAERAAREAAARRIAPGDIQVVPTDKSWPRDVQKPQRVHMQAELKRRLGGAEKVGRKKIDNMLLPDLVAELVKTPVEGPAPAPAPAPGEALGGDAETQCDRWCQVKHGPRLAHAIMENKEAFLRRDQKPMTRAELDGAARNSSWQDIVQTFNREGQPWGRRDGPGAA